MKSILLFCVFTVTITSLHGSVSLMAPDPNPNHPGHCNSDESGPMENGEMKTLPGCLRAQCLGDGSIEIASCGISSLNGKRCYPSKDNKKPYPECCQPDLTNCK
ncbi:hypothetical protein JTB14_001769 [Gonioctena quinquepunctata]|nr:hypothetical protein JTB14_001769 [Gonioctena quinquepunctata]